MLRTFHPLIKKIIIIINNNYTVEGRREMFYLMRHSTHFIYGYMASDMVKDHSDSERGNPLLPHGLLFSINSKDFYMHHPTDRITHTTAFVTPVVEHWLEREQLYSIKTAIWDCYCITNLGEDYRTPTLLCTTCFSDKTIHLEGYGLGSRQSCIHGTKINSN